MININELMSSSHMEVKFADARVDNVFVKEFRHTHKLTQVALANILGVTKKTIEKWEQGKNNVNGSSAVLLKLLNDNPVLLKQLYHVRKNVCGNPAEEEYTQLDSGLGSKSFTLVTTSQSPQLIKFPINQVSLEAQ